MEKTLQRIANLLILNLQNIGSIGLLNGKMGLAVYLYHYARHVSQPAYSDQADDLLDELFAALSGYLPPALTEGVAGVGLGLSHLIRNYFIETDESEDELFRDSDGRLLQNLNNQLLTDLHSNFPVFSLGFYLPSRVTTGKRTPQKDKLISQSLTGIHTTYINEKQAINPVFTNSVIHFLNGIYNQGMYKEKTRKTMKTVLTFIINYASTTNYYPIDTDILRYLLSSVEVNIELANRILAQINQFNIIPDNNTNMDIVGQSLQQYLLYPNLDIPNSFLQFTEKYVEDCIAESSQSGLSLLPYIGLNMMGVKLC